MSPDLQAWHARNDEYLGAALADLRNRLDKLARARFGNAGPAATRTDHLQAPLPPEPVPDQAEAKSGILSGLFRRGANPAEGSAQLTRLLPASPPAPGAPPPDANAADIARRLAQASQGEPPPALLMLARQFGLSDFERDILLLCVAMELDPALPAQLAALHGRADMGAPNFALAMTLFEHAAWEAVSPERPLRHWRLLDINQAGAQPLTASSLRADERIVNFVKGLNHLDERLAPLVSPVSMLTTAQLPPSQAEVAHAVTRSLQDELASHGQAVVALRGPDRLSKHDVAGAVSQALGLQLYRLPADALPSHAADIDALSRLWHRECLLTPLALLADGHTLDKSTAPDSPASRLLRFVAKTGGLLFVDSRDGLDLPVAAHMAVDIDKPTALEQGQAWAAALQGHAPQLAERLPAQLSAQFDLNRSDLSAIVKRVFDSPSQQRDAAPLEDRIWQACQASTRPQLARLAQRLDARASWDDIVLPPAEATMLRQIAAQVSARAQVYDNWGFRARMNRGLGVSALFAGDSGTGKTMAAEVLAHALRLDLYRVDLSAVVSKYIGETEKNLREVFDAAESGGAILFFDEADALFGKRSEVKDSHDRYANIEIDYLLQRMECFSGLAILATNMKSALDPAFTRRLRFIVNFPYPGQLERRRMWQRVFPAETPVGVLDLDRLAKLNLSGANIQSMALSAAFMAAQAGTPVTMNLLMEAGRIEMRKLDRPVNESEFRWVETASASGGAA
jgi:hypothetical protein